MSCAAAHAYHGSPSHCAGLTVLVENVPARKARFSGAGVAFGQNLHDLSPNARPKGRGPNIALQRQVRGVLPGALIKSSPRRACTGVPKTLHLLPTAGPWGNVLQRNRTTPLRRCSTQLEPGVVGSAGHPGTQRHQASLVTASPGVSCALAHAYHGLPSHSAGLIVLVENVPARKARFSGAGVALGQNLHDLSPNAHPKGRWPNISPETARGEGRNSAVRRYAGAGARKLNERKVANRGDVQQPVRRGASSVPCTCCSCALLAACRSCAASVLGESDMHQVRPTPTGSWKTSSGLALRMQLLGKPT